MKHLMLLLNLQAHRSEADRRRAEHRRELARR